MSSTEQRQRDRLLLRQGGKCHYCKRLLCSGAAELTPVLEHYVPRSRGGRGSATQKVLACHFCDSHKGMMTGTEYLGIVHQETKDGKTFEQAKQAVCRKAKKANIELQKKHRERHLYPELYLSRYIAKKEALDASSTSDGLVCGPAEAREEEGHDQD